jgi:hypothetical protein
MSSVVAKGGGDFFVGMISKHARCFGYAVRLKFRSSGTEYSLIKECVSKACNIKRDLFSNG